MYLGVKSFLHFRNVAGKVDHIAAVGHAVDLESVRLKPRRDLVDVFVGRSEFLSELCGRQPLVEVRRGLIQLLGHQRLERGLLFRAASEHQQHVIELHRRGGDAAILCRTNKRMNVAAKRCAVRFVDRLRDHGPRRDRLRGHMVLQGHEAK